MNKNIIILVILVLSVSKEGLFSQEKSANGNLLKNKYKIIHYLLKDSSASYIIREITAADGSRSYSIIPKSHIEENLEVVKENFPSTLLDWFDKEKYSGDLKKRKTDLLLGRKTGIIDTLGSEQKKNKTLWWILGATALVGGVTAYHFLQTKTVLEELPIQPNPPK